MNKNYKAFETVEGRKIYKIENISKSLKDDISEANVRQALMAALYTIGGLCGTKAIGSAMINGIDNTFFLNAAFGVLGILSGVITQNSSIRYNKIVDNDMDKMKKEIREQKEVYTTEDKNKINKIRYSIDKLRKNSDLISYFEGIFFSFATYLSANGLILARDNDKFKVPACLVALAYWLTEAGFIAISREQSRNINRKIDYLRDETTKPYTLIK